MKSSIAITLSLFASSALTSGFCLAGRPTFAGASKVNPRDWQYFRKVGRVTLSIFPFSSTNPVAFRKSIRPASTRAPRPLQNSRPSAHRRSSMNAPKPPPHYGSEISPTCFTSNLQSRARPPVNFGHRGEEEQPRGTSCTLSLFLRFHRPYPSCWAHAVVIHCLESVPIGAGGSWLPRNRLQLVWLGLKPAGSNWSSGCFETG